MQSPRFPRAEFSAQCVKNVYRLMFGATNSQIPGSFLITNPYQNQ
jgi:hypothetical protein